MNFATFDVTSLLFLALFIGLAVKGTGMAFKALKQGTFRTAARDDVVGKFTTWLK